MAITYTHPPYMKHIPIGASFIFHIRKCLGNVTMAIIKANIMLYIILIIVYH